jgi:hypothetical protein
LIFAPLLHAEPVIVFTGERLIDGTGQPPLDDIRNTTRLVAIYHGGKRIEPAFHSAP